MKVSREIKNHIMINKYLNKKGIFRIIQKENYLVLSGDIITLRYNLETNRIEIHSTYQSKNKSILNICELVTIEYALRKYFIKTNVA